MRTPAHESTLPPILGVSEMAALLGLSVRAVYYAMKRPTWYFRELPNVGGPPTWSRDQVVATIAAAPTLTVARRRG